MFSLHKINPANSEFLHSDSLGNLKNYNLYNAIKALYEYVIQTGFDINSTDYADLKTELESAMILETDLMDSKTQFIDVMVYTQTLTNIDPEYLQYTNLNRLFSFIINMGTTTKIASRVFVLKEVKSMSPLIIEPSTLVDVKNNLYNYTDSLYSFGHSYTTLEILNAQSSSRVEAVDLQDLVVAMDENIPIEKVLKNNLFNFSTFSNTELYLHTSIPDTDYLESTVKSLSPIMLASSYFNDFSHLEYQTFSNYIDFDILSTTVNYAITNFKYYLDAIDSSNITFNKDTDSYYPSGQLELFAVMSLMRRVLAMLAVIFNMSKMFVEQREIILTLAHYQSVTEDLVSHQIIEADTIGMTDKELTDYLYLADGYYNAFIGTFEVTDEFSIMVQDTSGRYNAYVKDGEESGLDLSAINDLIIGNMENIKKMTFDLKSLINILKGNTLPSFSFVLNLNFILDLSFLKKLSQLIAQMNQLLYDINCMLNAIACFASYVKDIYDTLKTFLNDDSKFDLTKYVVGGFSVGFNNSMTTVTTDQIFSNESSILKELATKFTKEQLSRVADALRYSIGKVNSTCITSWVEGLYEEAKTSMKESIQAGSRCKVTPGGRLSVDASLRLNLGVDIPDLRFKFRNCTGAN